MRTRKAQSVEDAIEAKEAENQPETEGDITYLVKLDSKRFESRTMNQVIDLLTGSEGIVSKITIERQ